MPEEDRKTQQRATGEKCTNSKIIVLILNNYKINSPLPSFKGRWADWAVAQG